MPVILGRYASFSACNLIFMYSQDLFRSVDRFQKQRLTLLKFDLRPMNLSIYVYIIVYYCYFIGFVGRSWSFLGLVPTQVSSIFSRLSRIFCRGFSWRQIVSCRYVSKTPLIFLDVFFTILFFYARLVFNKAQPPTTAQ